MHPYETQPDRAFWRRAIGDSDPQDISDWYVKRFSLDGKRIATAGSCFAQHIGRQLRKSGFDYVDMEPAPTNLPEAEHLNWGYSMYSARYGNVYTSRQLLQLVQRAVGLFHPQEDWWEKDGGIVDPFRPTIEPKPFGSVEEMRALRADHLARVAEMFTTADVLVFTLGLTESWLSRDDGAYFPLCPGTAGGTFDPARHQFRNLSSRDVRADMEQVLTMIRTLNPRIEVMLTVSPVSLMATATDQQVAVATVYSKSVLRAVAGELYADHPFVDYFPSYEIITGPASRGVFYKPGMRDVSPEGVAHVMKTFATQHTPNVEFSPRVAPGVMPGGPAPRLAAGTRPAPKSAVPFDDEDDMDVKCDEEILAVFGKPTAD